MRITILKSVLLGVLCGPLVYILLNLFLFVINPTFVVRVSAAGVIFVLLSFLLYEKLDSNYTATEKIIRSAIFFLASIVGIVISLFIFANGHIKI